MSVLSNLENVIFKLCGGCFIFGGFPIGNISNLDNCFVLNTNCLPFWKREDEIIINLVPFLPYAEMTIVKLTAYDGSRYGIEDVYGKKIDAESLEIQITYWSNRSNGYVLQNVHYLPDTKKTFGASLGGYPKTEDELNEAWQFRKEVHKKHSDKPIIDILQYATKPNFFHKIKYLIANVLVKFANHKHSIIQSKINNRV